MYNDYLTHYGVKGMRKGQRRSPRELARVLLSARASAGEVHDAVGDTLYRQTPVAGTRKKNYRVQLGGYGGTREKAQQMMVNRGFWRAKDRKRVRYR